ncbi:hypothetical protein [Streptomyces sp. NPDC006324]|uniref:hypothetical protein n=1 Tax=Streptomyces sp. NPDC006324 TaxID=3156751 RepID=UPI0033B0CC19
MTVCVAPGAALLTPASVGGGNRMIRLVDDDKTYVSSPYNRCMVRGPEFDSSKPAGAGHPGDPPQADPLRTPAGRPSFPGAARCRRFRVCRLGGRVRPSTDRPAPRPTVRGFVAGPGSSRVPATRRERSGAGGV